MKLLLAFSVSLWSLSALGSMPSLHGTQYFTGSGVAIHPDGSAERYLITLAASKHAAGKYMFSYDLQFGHGNVFFDLLHVHEHADSSFFSIYIGEMLVGHGYCWGSKCHTNWSHDGHHIENTFHRHRRTGMIHSMGSRSNQDGVVYLWKETLRRLK